MPDKRLSPVYYNKMEFVRENIGRPGRLLDVGCGAGGYFHIYREKGISYAGIEPDASVIAEGGHVKIASAESIPFRPSGFDAVVCADALEHTEDDRKALAEIARVLKPKGILLLSVPSARYPWPYDPLNAALRPFGARLHNFGMWGWGHRRLYKREELLQLLAVSGFDVVKIEERTHGFAAFFISYMPYIIMHAGLPLMKRLGARKFGRVGVSPGPVKRGFVFKAYGAINRLDSRHFGRTHGITLCVVARKKSPSGKPRQNLPHV
jgi:SAM-dependent methyltransferase